MARSPMIRSTSSTSSSSTLSCITVNQIKSIDQTVTPTPPTSNTDAASISSRGSTKHETSLHQNRRVQRVSRSGGSYNENVLTGSVKRATRRKSVMPASRTISGDTLAGDTDGHSRQLVEESIQVLDLDWEVDAMPGDSMKQSMKSPDGMRKKPISLKVLGRASDALSRTRGVLGKRSREVAQLGKEKLQDLNRRASLRPREPDLDVPTAKRARILEVSESQIANLLPSGIERKYTTGQRVKCWLSQGLYVGQDRDFDARLTETKNKQKKASSGSIALLQQSILPLPMFAGQRAMELGRDFRLPFDVFSPLPPGQPKPEEWRKTQKNVFVGDAAQVWKVTKHLEASKCICEPSSGCDENCFNRFMFYECDDSNCNIGAEQCTNRSFDALRERCKAGGKYNIGVEVMKTVDRGHGVRSNRTFDPNQIIVEYAGEIITQDECDHRMRTRYKDNECYYLMSFDQNMIIDATRGSIARFVNHSCEPNCKMIKWTVAGKPRMALFAGEKGIMTGEELTYDYNFDPFSTKNIQACRCGKASCRGVLGPKPKERGSSKSKDFKDALAPLITANTKRKAHQAIEQSVDNITKKKRRMTMPASIQAAFDAAKSQASTHLTKAKSLVSSQPRNAMLINKTSERSLRGPKRAQTVHAEENRVRRSTTVTYSRRRSSGTSVDDEVSKDDRPLSRRKNVKVAASSIRKNVVRTVRGANRSGAVGKTIRVIEDK